MIFPEQPSSSWSQMWSDFPDFRSLDTHRIPETMEKPRCSYHEDVRFILLRWNQRRFIQSLWLCSVVKFKIIHFQSCIVFLLVFLFSKNQLWTYEQAVKSILFAWIFFFAWIYESFLFLKVIIKLLTCTRETILLSFPAQFVDGTKINM